MRGKPKGIRRKLAKHEATIPDKLRTSMYGYLAEYAELSGYGDIHYIRWLERERERTGRYPNKLKDGLVETWKIECSEWAGQTLIDAILDNDVSFFERMAQIAKWYRSGQPSVDNIACLVLIAATQLLVRKQKVTSTNIARILEERFPKADDSRYDERDIRRVMRDLGVSKNAQLKVD